MIKLIVSAIFLPVLLAFAIPSVMAQQSGYNLTVNIGSHQFGNPNVTVGVTTANGNYRQTYTINIQNPSVTFNIPPDSGPSVQVCVGNSGLLEGLTANCQTFDANGNDMTVDMNP